MLPKQNTACHSIQVKFFPHLTPPSRCMLRAHDVELLKWFCISVMLENIPTNLAIVFIQHSVQPLDTT